MPLLRSKTACAVLAAIALAALAAPAPAGEPPPRSTIQQRVDGATNIFIGTAYGVRVVKFVDGKPQDVKPEPALLDAGEFAEIEVKPSEAMYPTAWQPPGTILFYFGGGQFNVAAIRGHVLATKLIYPAALDKDRGVFVSSYPWHLADTLDERPDFQTAIDARVKREGGKSDGTGK